MPFRTCHTGPECVPSRDPVQDPGKMPKSCFCGLAGVHGRCSTGCRPSRSEIVRILRVSDSLPACLLRGAIGSGVGTRIGGPSGNGSGASHGVAHWQRSARQLCRRGAPGTTCFVCPACVARLEAQWDPSEMQASSSAAPVSWPSRSFRQVQCGSNDGTRTWSRMRQLRCGVDSSLVLAVLIPVALPSMCARRMPQKSGPLGGPPHHDGSRI